MLFADALRNNKPIKVFNNGDMIRDFTYNDDIAEGTVLAIDHTLDKDSCPHRVPYKKFIIGCSNPIKLMDFVSEMEQAFGKDAIKEFLPMQPGDVYQTNADCSALEHDMSYHPHVTLHDGIKEFVKWYKRTILTM